MDYDFTFCALDLEITADQKQLMLNEIGACNISFWYDDKFRGCSILPLYNGDGTTGAPKDGVLRSEGILKFTEAGEQCQVIKDFIISKVFPFMDPPGRISILKTNAGNDMNVHMDTSQKDIGSIQHKFRIVLNGEIGKLYFLDSKLNKIYVPDHFDSYVLDGTHPHAISAGKEEKITLCIGTPWRGKLTNEYSKLISNSPFKMKVSMPEFREEWENK
jgi:hypothetical protein